ncbi:hypothetical protein Ancab_035710, partial [Ancistrocladus abbreviatus]
PREEGTSLVWASGDYPPHVSRGSPSPATSTPSSVVPNSPILISSPMAASSLTYHLDLGGDPRPSISPLSIVSRRTQDVIFVMWKFGDMVQADDDFIISNSGLLSLSFIPLEFYFCYQWLQNL